MSSQTQILILGGTGRVGQLVIAEALKRDIPVTALIRKEGALQLQNNLTTITGSPLLSQDISKALSSIRSKSPSANVVIISTLGQTRKSGNPWAATTSPPRFMAEAAQAVVDAINSLDESRRSNISKMVQLSKFGAKSSMANLNMLMRGIMTYSNMVQTVEDHNLTSDVISENFAQLNSSALGRLQIPAVMIRPAMLKFGAEQDGEVKVYGNEGVGAGYMPSIQARDVARFLVDAVVSEEWNGKTPVISN